MLHNIIDAVKGENKNGNKKKIEGKVVLMKKNVLDFNDFDASILDGINEFLGQRVLFRLINMANGKVGDPGYLEDWLTTITPLTAGETAFKVSFNWKEEDGIPGAFIVRNEHHSEFYLRNLTLQDFPVPGQSVHFLCNSWVYPAKYYKNDRVFFANKWMYLPHETPQALVKYREEELATLRGNGEKDGELQEWDRIYDYAYYNDLADTDKGADYARPVLGGSSEYPYPRRGKTGRAPTKSESKTAWRTDVEFAREMLAGVNPMIISRLKEFPPKTKLDKNVYGDQNSSITEKHVKNSLEGMTIEKAMKDNRLYILDHHDTMMPYLRRINSINGRKIYATRILLLLNNEGTLKPLAIDLSLPHNNGDRFGAVSKVYTPSEDGIQGSIWQLAKAYAAVNDAGYHQLFSHWLNTHASIEPFVIATNRQLSVLHPIHKLLQPHFRDTTNINALARQILINAGGILELTVFPAKYSMEMSSVVYKNWVFTEQALPVDLKKRPECSPWSTPPIEDYPYAVDGLEIWFAIRKWVEEYCNFYYQNDEMVLKDTELQQWWKEVREEGHGEKKHELWWPKMQTRNELIESCTIIIWLASTVHAAVNFGQYPYAGYMPNRPTISRRFMPEEGSPEYEELRSNPELSFLRTITAQFQTLLGIALIELLSRHSSDEVYLGKRDDSDWTTDERPLQAFEEFGKRLEGIEEKILQMNADERFKNRFGLVQVPYTLLFPTSGGEITGKGIPNSITI